MLRTQESSSGPDGLRLGSIVDSVHGRRSRVRPESPGSVPEPVGACGNDPVPSSVNNQVLPPPGSRSTINQRQHIPSLCRSGGGAGSRESCDRIISLTHYISKTDAAAARVSNGVPVAPVSRKTPPPLTHERRHRQKPLPHVPAQSPVAARPGCY